MKKIVLFIMAALFACALVGCSNKNLNFSIGEASELQVEIGYDGEDITIRDSELIKEITDNINSLQYERKSKAVGMIGRSYLLVWNDEEGNKIAELSIVDTEGYQILYDGYYYNVKADLAINVDLIRVKGVTQSVYDTLEGIQGENIVKASFDSLIPNYIYDIEDLSIVEDILETLDDATFVKCEPEQTSSSMEFVYITTDEHEYRIGIINNAAFSILVDGEQRYYSCNNKDGFLQKMFELQGR